MSEPKRDEAAAYKAKAVEAVSALLVLRYDDASLFAAEFIVDRVLSITRPDAPLPGRSAERTLEPSDEAPACRRA